MPGEHEGWGGWVFVGGLGWGGSYGMELGHVEEIDSWSWGWGAKFLGGWR